MFWSIKTSSALLAAALAVTGSTVPFSTAEAQWRGRHHGGHYYHHRGAGVAAGIAAGALLGGALLAPRAYAQPYAYGGPVYVDEPAECYIQRQRVWSERRGRYITVNREVCD